MSAAHAAPRARLFWPALLTVAGTLVLCALGSWQLARMGEKHAYIARLTAQAASAPAPLPAAADWPRQDLATLDLARVVASGRFLPVQATVRTTIAAPGPGAARQLAGFGRWVFQPLQLDGGGTILVNRGFVPEARLGEVAPAAGPARITGYLRLPEARGAFTPADLPAVREFYTRDPAAIAAALGAGPVAPFYLEAEREGDGLTPPAGVEVRELLGRIPDNHLAYAFTWFGLACTLVGVFAAFAWQQRRQPAEEA